MRVLLFFAVPLLTVASYGHLIFCSPSLFGTLVANLRTKVSLRPCGFGFLSTPRFLPPFLFKGVSWNILAWPLIFGGLPHLQGFSLPWVYLGLSKYLPNFVSCQGTSYPRYLFLSPRCSLARLFWPRGIVPSQVFSFTSRF